jgi:acetyltransferase
VDTEPQRLPPGDNAAEDLVGGQGGEREDAHAEAARFGRLLEPRSVAVVGASESGLGSVVFGNMLCGFNGPVIPVNPSRSAVHGIATVASVAELPLPVDLAIVIVPHARVLDVIEGCIARGVGSAVIMSAGFAEAGLGGLAAQRRLGRLAAAHDFPILGPNCNGYINAHAAVAASFAVRAAGGDLPAPGPVALVSQSGGFGSFILRKAMAAELGIGWYVSTGNEADITVGRTLRHIVGRPDVELILAFTEAVRSPGAFLDAVRGASLADKPIVAVRAGYSAAGARAAISHTASVVGSSEAYDAICDQYGVVRARSIEEMLDFALALRQRRRTKGRRLGVLTQSGGSGVLMVDEAVSSGMTVPLLHPGDERELRALLPSFASTANPVDTTGAFDQSNYGKVLATLAGSAAVDAVVSLLWTVGEAEARAVRAAVAATGKPIALATLAPCPQATGTVLVYPDPVRAVRALAALARFSDRAPVTQVGPAVNVGRQTRARQLLDRERGRPFLLEHSAKQLLGLYGIPACPEGVARSADRAAQLAEAVGGAVALKVLSYGLPHKTDADALRLNVAPRDAAAAYRELLAGVRRQRPDLEVEGVLVQPMVPTRIEVSCGLQRDPAFGPMIATGLGGTQVELIGAAAILHVPFDEPHALRAISGGKLARSARGLDREQLARLARIMTALAELAVELPEIASVDINPLRGLGETLVCVDALVVLDGAAAPDGNSPQA